MNERPNFLFIVTDQMQAACLSCAGHPDVQTPNIDKLVAAGTHFQRGYVNNSVCMPSRATMITGLTPRQHGLLTNGCSLPEHVPTITELLRQDGYQTYAVGKLHLQPYCNGPQTLEGHTSWEDTRRWDTGEITELPSPYYGFEHSDFLGGHVHYSFGAYKQWLEREHPGEWDKYQPENGREFKHQAWKMDLDPSLHYNNWIADKTIHQLQHYDKDDSFFIWCSFPDPHFPFAACAEYAEMFDPAALTLPENWQKHADSIEFLQRCREKRSSIQEDELRMAMAQTYGMIKHVDDNIGRILDSLEETGFDKNTIVVFLSDHGEYLGSHNLLMKAEWAHEALLNIPFIWKDPRNAQGMKCNTPVSMLDIVPTIADYTGIEQSAFNVRGMGLGATPCLPGRSLRSCIQDGEALDDVPVLVEYDEDWGDKPPACRMRGIIFKHYKLITYAGPAAGSVDGILIDLANDPYELDNKFHEANYRDIKLDLYEKLMNAVARSDRFDTLRITGA